MLFKHSPVPAKDVAPASAEDNRWRLADLEAAQRRNIYAAGAGDRQRSLHRWPRLLGKRR
jgi:hypothetical protein